MTRGMSFDEALKAIFDMQKVRREGWNSRNTFIYAYATPNYDRDLTHPFLVIDTSGARTDNPNYKKGRAPYTPSQCDIFAADWVIYKDESKEQP